MNTPIRIGYDIGSMFGRNGIARYCRELVNAVMEFENVHPILVGSKEQHQEVYAYLGTDSRAEVRLPLTNERALGAPLRRLVRIWRRRQMVDAFHGADVVHFLGPQKIFPNHSSTVSTIHDLIPLYQEFDVERELRNRFPGIIARQLEHSRAVVCPSQWVADTIREKYPWYQGSIHVTPLAAGEQFVQRPLSNATRQTHSIERPYFLFVGRLDIPRKNLVRMIRAWMSIKESDRAGKEFIVVTNQRDHVVTRFLHDPALGRIDGSVRVLNEVPTPQLVELLGSAIGLVFASQAEGFGLPILEAMQCGCPVITSSVSSMPEVGGQAALYVDPMSVDEIRDAMIRLLDDPALQSDLRQRGLAQASQFSWSKTAAETMSVYSKLSSK